jgi:hypothetical protein
VTAKLWVAVAVSVWRWQLTVAVDVPGLVLVPTFHVHETLPEAPATGCGCKPTAVEIVPEAYRTLAPQVAPGAVRATRVTLAPCLTDAARFVMLTERYPTRTAGTPALSRGAGGNPTVDVPNENGIP